MAIIDDFIENYRDGYPSYDQVRRYAEGVVEQALRDAGIMAITSSRVKDAARLREKLLFRQQTRSYQSFADIEADIADFVGIRVALYFPNDQKKVEAVVRQLFEVEKIKVFPDEQRKNDVYSRRFSGYCATHYRVYLREEERIRNSLRRVRIEIQVASLLMHAWSEVEHDLTYKQKKGLVSYDEYESLDEINGLVIAGEISLQRLQRLSELRLASESRPFTNHYLLASYLYDQVSPHYEGEIVLGDVETLFRVLKSKKRLTPQKISNDLQKLDYDDPTPVAQQIIDMYADNSMKISQLVLRVRDQKTSDEIANKADNKLIGSFLRSWTGLEKAIDAAVRRIGYPVKVHSFQTIYPFLSQEELLCPDSLETYMQLRQIRDEVLHGRETPDRLRLQTCISQLRDLTAEIKAHENEAP